MDGFIIVTEFGSNAQVLIAAAEIRYIFALTHPDQALGGPPAAKARIALKPDAAQTVDVTQTLTDVVDLLRKLNVRISALR